MERWGLARSRAITTVSRPATSKLVEYGLDVPIHVVPNGLEPTWFPEYTDQERRDRRTCAGDTRTDCRWISRGLPGLPRHRSTPGYDAGPGRS